MDIIKARYQGGLSGASPVIKAAWKLGVEIEYWSLVSNKWQPRYRPKYLPDPTGWYRLKPKDAPNELLRNK